MHRALKIEYWSTGRLQDRWYRSQQADAHLEDRRRDRMSDFDLPVSPALVQRLTSEINRIGDQQIEALRTATFVGMTEAQAKAYQDRRNKLRELVRQLEVITSRRAA